MTPEDCVCEFSIWSAVLGEFVGIVLAATVVGTPLWYISKWLDD